MTALKFGDLDRGDKFNGCLSMDEVRIIQESKINDDENDGVETSTTQTRTFQKPRVHPTIQHGEDPEQTQMLRELYDEQTTAATNMHEFERAAFSNLQPQDARGAHADPSLGAKNEAGEDRSPKANLIYSGTERKHPQVRLMPCNRRVNRVAHRAVVSLSRGRRDARAPLSPIILILAKQSQPEYPSPNPVGSEDFSSTIEAPENHHRLLPSSTRISISSKSSSSSFRCRYGLSTTGLNMYPVVR